MNALLVSASLAGAALALIFLLLWLGARADAGRARGRVAELETSAREAGDDTDALTARLRAAEGRVRELEARTWLDDFAPELVFTLVARGDQPLPGGLPQHGVVRDEAGRLLPFLTARDLGALAAGDVFTSVRGQLVKLDAAAATSAEQNAATLMFDARELAPAAPADPGATVVARAPDAISAGMDQTLMIKPGAAAALRDPSAGLPWLEVIEGPDRGERFPVSFRGASVGREKSNQVALADSGASRVHCHIEYHGHRFLLRDNASTNGTLCNGETVSVHELAFGDVVQVAETRMRWTCEGFELRGKDPVGAVRAFEQTLERDPDYAEAIRNLAFLLEKDIARKKEAQPLWDRLAKLEA